MRYASLFALWLVACVGQVIDGPGGDDGRDGGADTPTTDGGPETVDARPSADAAPPAPLPSIDFDSYHDQDEIAAYLRAVAAARPDIVTFAVLGESYGGLEIAYVVIDATGDPDPPSVYLNGTHHGDEKSSTETTLAFVDYVLQRPDDPDVATLLDDYAIYVQPLVNPDGHEDHRREDYFGRDPNRDYAYPGRSEDNSFDIQECRLVKQLQDAQQFKASIAYHSGITEVVWPWGSTSSATDDHDLFHTISKAAADEMGFGRYMQSWYDYPANGEYSDYAYWKHGTLSVTFEVSSDKTPPSSQLAPIVDRAVAGTMAFLIAVHDTDSGAMAVEIEGTRAIGTVGAVRVIDGEKLE